MLSNYSQGRAKEGRKEGREGGREEGRKEGNFISQKKERYESQRGKLE